MRAPKVTDELKEVLRRYEVLECDLAAQQFQTALRRAGIRGMRLTIEPDLTSVPFEIRAARPDARFLNRSISLTGYHEAIQVGARINDNVYPDGLPAVEWRQAYLVRGPGAATELTLDDFLKREARRGRKLLKREPF